MRKLCSPLFRNAIQLPPEASAHPWPVASQVQYANCLARVPASRRGATWAEQFPPVSPPRRMALEGITYDPVAENIVLFGGCRHEFGGYAGTPFEIPGYGRETQRLGRKSSHFRTRHRRPRPLQRG